MTRLHFIRFVCILLLSTPAFCQDDAEQALNVFDKKNNIDFFSQMMPSRMRVGNKLIALQDRRLRHAIENNNQKGIAISANNLGYYYLKNGDYVQAINYFQQALNAYNLLAKPEGIALAKTQLAFALDQSGRDDNALSLYKEASAAFENLPNKKQLPFIYALQGIIYLQKNDSVNASFFINKALQLFTSSNDLSSKSKLYSRIGEVALAKNQYALAIENFTSGLKFSRAQKDNNETAIGLRDIGIAYFKKGDFEKALDYFNRSLAIKDDLLVKKLIKDCYLKIVTVASFKKDFEQADKYHELYRNLKREIAKMPETESNVEQLAEKEKIIQLLSIQNEEQNKILTKQDYELSQQLTATEIERQSKEKALEQLTLTEEQKRVKELQLEKMAAEKARQEAILIKQELQLSKQKEYRNIFLMISGIVLLGLFWLYNRYAIKKRSLEKLNEAHEKLSEAHMELNKAHEQLKQTQEQLVQSEKMASLGQLTAGIAHEIQNPLNFVNNFSTLSIDMLNEFENGKDPEILNDLKVNLSKINQHGNRISSIVKGMLLHSRNEPVEKQMTDVNTLLDESFTLAFHGKRSTEPSFYCKLEKNFADNLPMIPLMSQDIRRVFINIINNAFYAVQEKYQQLKANEALNGFVPEVYVGTLIKNNQVEIVIKDNGLGIPVNIKEKVFNPFFTSKPTGKGTGLGLSVSFDIVTKGHGGTLNFESENNIGTTFIITLPINPINRVKPSGKLQAQA